VSEIADSKTHCVVPMEGDTGMGLVCKQDLDASSSPVQCVRCGQLFGSAIEPMLSCMVQTQPYTSKWLRMESKE
ncbi:unnamed protein product, partial [Symbiodinium pilosum]